MNTLTLQVQENLHVQVLPNPQHEFLMTTNEVANGYGVTNKAIRKHSTEHSDELVEGKHWVKGATISSSLSVKNLQPHATLWTKRGIIRLGFFIKSKRAKQFRDWAEDLIIFATEQAGLEQRLAALEQRISNLTILPENLNDKLPSAKDLKNYFKQHLNRGDLSKIAKKTGYAYRYLQAVKLQNKSSKAVEEILLQQCQDNRTKNIERNLILQS